MDQTESGTQQPPDFHFLLHRVQIWFKSSSTTSPPSCRLGITRATFTYRSSISDEVSKNCRDIAIGSAAVAADRPSCHCSCSSETSNYGHSEADLVAMHQRRHRHHPRHRLSVHCRNGLLVLVLQHSNSFLIFAFVRCKQSNTCHQKALVPIYSLVRGAIAKIKLAVVVSKIQTSNNAEKR